MTHQLTLTKLSLYEWARIMGVNPLHFCGVQIGATQGSTVGGSAWFQHEWQDNDRTSREELARIIREAEDAIETLLGYRLLPAWEQDEWKPTTRPFRPETVNLNDRDVRGRGQHVRLNWGHLLSGGIRAKSAIQTGVAISYASTRAPDTYKDTATITVATTVTDPEEIRVYYAGKSGADGWEIRPIEVSIVSGTATITFPRELAVLEEVTESMDIGNTLRAADGTDDAKFLTQVDVYRVYNDPQQQAHLVWEPTDRINDTEAGLYTTQTAVLWMRGDPREPEVVYAPATWDATNLQFDYAIPSVARQPDLLRLWYYAGNRAKELPTPKISMEPMLARAVSIMAASRLDRREASGNAAIKHWQTDLAVRQQGQRDSRGTPASQLQNPFGTKRGEVEAYRLVRPLAKGQSASA